MSDNKVSVQLFYFFALLMGLLCLWLIAINFAEVKNIQRNMPDIYLFLPKKQGIIYSVSWGVIFTILFTILCLGFIKQKRAIVFRTAILIFLCWPLSAYLYHFLTHFISFDM